MSRSWIAAALMAAALAAAPAHAAKIPAAVAAALADPGRSDADKQLDDTRKPSSYRGGPRRFRFAICGADD